jgi:hypothetical protein
MPAGSETRAEQAETRAEQVTSRRNGGGVGTVPISISLTILSLFHFRS